MKVPFFLSAVLVVAASAPAFAADQYVDALCSTASAAVNQYQTLMTNPNTPVDDAIAAAKRAVDVYDRCASDRLANGQLESNHYAVMRSAQFRSAMGHWQRLTDQNDEARASFTLALKQLAGVIDWRTGSATMYSSNDKNVGSGSLHNGLGDSASQFHDEAVKIRDATQAELNLVPKPGAAAAGSSKAPAPGSSPPTAPLPSPGY